MVLQPSAYNCNSRRANGATEREAACPCPLWTTGRELPVLSVNHAAPGTRVARRKSLHALPLRICSASSPPALLLLELLGQETATRPGPTRIVY